jgi:hypothetical protein
LANHVIADIGRIEPELDQQLLDPKILRRVFERAIEYCSRIDIGAAHTFPTTMAGIGPKTTVAPILCGYRTRRRPFSRPDVKLSERTSPTRQYLPRCASRAKGFYKQRGGRGDKSHRQRSPITAPGFPNSVTAFAISPAQTVS